MLKRSRGQLEHRCKYLSGASSLSLNNSGAPFLHTEEQFDLKQEGRKLSLEFQVVKPFMLLIVGEEDSDNAICRRHRYIPFLTQVALFEVVQSR